MLGDPNNLNWTGQNGFSMAKSACCRLKNYYEQSPVTNAQILGLRVLLSVFLLSFSVGFFVLDQDGTFLHSQGTAELESGRGYNEEVFLAFLNQWKPN